MDGIAAMERHMGFPKEIEFKNKDGSIDKVKMSPLTGRRYPEFWGLFKEILRISPSKEGEEVDPKKFFDAIDERGAATLIKLLKESIKKSNQGVKEETLDYFVSKNFFILIDALFELNLPSEDQILDASKKEKVNPKLKR